MESVSNPLVVSTGPELMYGAIVVAVECRTVSVESAESFGYEERQSVKFVE